MKIAKSPFPQALAELAAGRDHISTTEFATTLSRSAKTVRKNFCLNGHCFNIRPVKVGGRLLWPVLEVARLLNGEAQ